MPNPNMMAFDRQSARSIDADGRLHVIKACIKCGIDKPGDAYSKRAKSADGLQSVCKCCAKIAKKRWVEQNKDYVVAYAKKAGAEYRDKNRSLIAQQKREYHKKNAKALINKVCEWQKENRGRVNAKNAAWRKANPGKCNAKSARRRARKFTATPSWADLESIRGIYEAAKALDGFDVDHIVPLNSKLVCGLHVPDNLQIIPSIENQRKGNKHWPDMP